MLIETAGAFTGAIEAGNNLAVQIQHLTLAIDSQAGTGVMHVGSGPRRVERRRLKFVLWSRLVEVGVFTRVNERIVTLHGGVENLALHRLGLKFVLDRGGELRQRVAAEKITVGIN